MYHPSGSPLTWKAHHNRLLTLRSEVSCAERIQNVNRALLAGERVCAASYDLNQLKMLQQRKAQPLLTPPAGPEIAHFLALIQQVTPARLHDQAQFRTLYQQVEAVIEAFPWQYASLPLVQHRLFNHCLLLWQQTLEALFDQQDHRHVLHYLTRIFSYSMLKIPLLGETLELYPLLVDLEAASQNLLHQSRSVDPLTDFISAADLIYRGMLTFGTTAAAAFRGRPVPDARALAEAVTQHQLSVTERTHPWFLTKDSIS